jgi:hypothetical protein
VAAVRLLGWLGLVLFGCVLVQLHVAASPACRRAWAASSGNGWRPGAARVRLGRADLLALTGLIIGAQAAAGFSWLHVAELTGRGLHYLSAWLVGVDRPAPGRLAPSAGNPAHRLELR